MNVVLPIPQSTLFVSHSFLRVLSRFSYLLFMVTALVMLPPSNSVNTLYGVTEYTSERSQEFRSPLSIHEA